jgi:hypothetical protein
VLFNFIELLVERDEYVEFFFTDVYISLANITEENEYSRVMMGMIHILVSHFKLLVFLIALEPLASLLVGHKPNQI